MKSSSISNFSVDTTIETTDSHAKCISYKWDDSECWRCWQMFPPAEIKEEVKLKNRKYCWLYPKEEERKALTELVPDFRNCNKQIYTKCDFQLEACVHEQLLKLEDEFKGLESLVDKEMTKQNKHLNGMWNIAQRLRILTHPGIPIKPYPEIISAPEEHRLLCEFRSIMKNVNLSNCRISNSIANIQSTLKRFERCIARLDLTLQSPFIVGECGVKYRPLAYLRNIIADLYQYFYDMICKLKCWAQLIDPNDLDAIESYKALIHPEETDYETYLKVGIEDCTCLRAKKRDCIKPFTPC